jgi:hypothetical protein
MLTFGYVDGECRQDQIGLGAKAATGDASCGRFDPGSQRPVAALRTWRADASPPVMIFWSMIPKKPVPDLIRDGNRFSDKIMLKV